MKSKLQWLGLLGALAFFSNSVMADLVAYWPMNEGTVGTPVTVADDVIDAGLTFTDAVPNNANATWVNDATRGTVISTVEGNRFSAGRQGIDLNDGFTWSLWANVASSNTGDPGADVVIGTRNGGTWHKIDRTSISNWASIGGYDLADDTWHHLAYVGDLANGVSFYIDGALVGTDPTLPTTTYNEVFEIGGSSRFSEDVTGLYSDVAVWNEALSETRIQELAAGGPVIIIPEPSSMILFGFGLAAVAGARVRFRRG